MQSQNAKLMEREQRLRDAISKLPKAKLVSRRDVTDDLMAIELQPEIKFSYKPGQYCTLGLDSVERAYSIVSAPHEQNVEIFVELVPLPDGVLTPLMWELKVGDSMSIRPHQLGAQGRIHNGREVSPPPHGGYCYWYRPVYKHATQLYSSR